jgi:hypothetical protein
VTIIIVIHYKGVEPPNNSFTNDTKITGTPTAHDKSARSDEEPPGNLATGQGSEDAMSLSQEWGEKSKSKQKTTTTVVTELPEETEEDVAKKSQKSPECKNNNQHEAGNAARTPDEGTELPQLGSSITTKTWQEKPKRKYKTEVEKLLESQNGTEITSLRRAVAVVSGDIVSEPESIEALIEGDGPKTGRVE